MLDVLLLPGLRHERPRDERAERNRVAELEREERHAKADAEHGDQGRLGTIEVPDPSHRARDDQHPEAEQGRQEQRQPAHGDREPGRGEPAPPGEGGEHRHEQDRDQVLDDEDADDELPELAPDAELVERLGDDGGARDRDDGAGEGALHGRPAEEAPGDEPEPEHDGALDERRDAGDRADLRELAQAELEPQREHEQDDAQLGERLDDPDVGHQRDRDVRADDEPGDDVAEDHRLPEPLEHDGRDGGHTEDHGECDQELVGAVHHL